MIRKSLVLTFAILLVAAMTAMASGNKSSNTCAQKSACTTNKTAAKATMIGDKSSCTTPGQTSTQTRMIGDKGSCAATCSKSAKTGTLIGDKSSCSASRTSTTAQMTNAESPATVTMTGTLACSTCALKAEGANAACSEHGCTTALRTADGRFVTLMPNKYSENLLANRKLSSKPIEITGTYFANANMLDVQSYSIDGGQPMSWCDHCKSMDACRAKASGSL
jgi:hypothetical protein